MEKFEIIRRKLEAFIRKYYINELIRGVLLFLAIGLLYFLVTLLVEYYLWLNSLGRKLLFWTFIGVEIGLFVRFILFPLSQLFRFRKGIGYEEASAIIGTYFSEVGDKLLNLIQLSQNPQQSDLLLASIDQKASELQPIPFTGAIHLKENLKYLKYVAIPVVLFLGYVLLGDIHIFSGSYQRVVNYDVAYEPPAPFSFVIENETLRALENRTFTLQVATHGDVVPEEVQIVFDGQAYSMQPTGTGRFEYTFHQPTESLSFRLQSHKVRSQSYLLNVVETPVLSDFEMQLDFPRHTGLGSRTVRSTGNATIPEGTAVTWTLKAKNTDRILFKTADTVYAFRKDGNTFSRKQQLFGKTDYTLTTSNQELPEFEQLTYSLEVIKDEYPEIQVEQKRDSTHIERVLFRGQISDDYGLTKLQLVYYPEQEEDAKQTVSIPINTGVYDEFVYQFPGVLSLEPGVAYHYYFEVFDNDAIHHFKATRSSVFSFRKLTDDEIRDEQLQKQQEGVENLNRSFQEIKENKALLDELSQSRKEKSELNYNDKRKLDEFLKRQQKQEEMMKKFSEDLHNDLEEFDDENDAFKEELQQRLEENKARSEENEKLLKELEELQDKIKQEDLIEKLEEMANERKKQERNLEQLVELTKRYYVRKKSEKLFEELQKLGEKQESLSEKGEDENTSEAQESLKEEFDNWLEEIEELREENESLKAPMDFLQEDPMEDEIQMDQQDATDQLDMGQPQNAKPKQQSAGQKMQQMSQMKMMAMEGGAMDALDEDIRTLRQILSNLIRFSFEQEDLILEFRDLEYGGAAYGEKMRKQNEIRNNFHHIDDSIFALSIRQPRIGDRINSLLTDLDYNMDMALANFADNKFRQGLVNQRYTLVGSNDLAVLLDELLDQMNSEMMMMMSAGSGQSSQPTPGGEGGKTQLPDIIKQQESLMDSMSEGSGSGEQEGGEGESGDGEEGNESSGGETGEGEGNDSGNDGKDGQQGSEHGDGNNSQGDGNDSYDDGLSGELFEVYKQQQKLRMELEQLLREHGLQGGDAILEEMKNIENRLLQEGFNSDIRRRMELLKYQLLKLDEAFYEQGEEERREAETNKKEYQNTHVMDEELIKKYFQTIEILNRETLPLRDLYKLRVRDYFKSKHD